MPVAVVKPPPRTGRTEQWSPASPWAMRDAAYDLLKQMPELKSVFKVTPGSMMPEDLPAVVFDLSDTATAAGQGNQGALSFEHRSTLTISIQCSDNSNFLVDGTIWALGEMVLMQILRNQDFPREYLEGVERIGMNLRIPREGETFYASLNIAMDITTRSDWEPIVPNKLREIMINRRLTPTQTETGLDWDIIYPDWEDG